MLSSCLAVAGSITSAKKKRAEEHEEFSDETTPTTVSDGEEVTHDEESELAGSGGASEAAPGDERSEAPRQLGPGLFPPSDDCEVYDGSDGEESATTVPPESAAGSAALASDSQPVGAHFTPHETLLVFDWDDTILPSTWIQRQRLRLDAGSVVNSSHRRVLSAVADSAAKMLEVAKAYGTIVLLTNAERGWIELSCHKFLPTLLPTIENIKIVSARTTYEGPGCTSPLDWKVRAFEAEIARACGADALVDPLRRKNIHSLGDSVYEREALLRATMSLPSCWSKSVKFVERPDLQQLLKQHDLVTSSFEQIVQYDGHLDTSITC